MTLKRKKKNHYNAQLFRGCGCSIMLKDKKMVLRGGLNIFARKAEVKG